MLRIRCHPLRLRRTIIKSNKSKTLYIKSKIKYRIWTLMGSQINKVGIKIPTSRFSLELNLRIIQKMRVSLNLKRDQGIEI